MSDIEQAPKKWRGRFYEDFDIGDVFKSRLARTVTQTDELSRDHQWYTCRQRHTHTHTLGSLSDLEYTTQMPYGLLTIYYTHSS